MTEHEKRQDAETDKRVSDSYRELANERAPDHLNRAILRRAGAAARPKFSLTRAWTRPLAWAATIALSVALVLEVSKVPAPDAVTFEADNNAAALQKREPEAPEDAPSEAGVVDALEETESVPASVAAQSEVSAFIQPANQPAPNVARRQVEQIPERRDATAFADTAAPSTDADAFKSRNSDMLRQADEMARLRAGENKEPGNVGAEMKRAEDDGGRIASLASIVVESGCDETAKSTAATWSACIEALERAGDNEEAERQREALQEAFPDFNPE